MKLIEVSKDGDIIYIRQTTVHTTVLTIHPGIKSADRGYVIIPASDGGNISDMKVKIIGASDE